MSEVTFLPYVRRGLARALENVDPLQGGLPRDPEVTAFIDVEGQRARQVVRLRGPGDATALGAGQVLRTEPSPDSVDVEANYFPLVELRAPDLPWLLTPAAPTTDGRLRPWLVLVAVPDQRATLRAQAASALPVLTIAEPAGELPDLTDSWAWVHVQSLVSSASVADAMTTGSSDVFARLVCPRKLDPDTRYTACLVPAFEDGRLRGLGLPVPTGATVEPAWTTSSLAATIELPVYHSWSFTTGRGGDFEALCRRLKPDVDGAELGLHTLDITAPGIVAPSERTVLVDMEGALRTLEARPRPWPEKQREALQDAVEHLVNAGIQRTDYDPAVIDPVVAPPTYGAWPAAATKLPQHGWLPELNLDPVPRAAAGLGARVVRTNQESLVAAAWEQAGELRATIDLLNRARLAVEITRSAAVRASTIEDADVLRLTGRLHPLVAAGASSVAAELAASAVPLGSVTFAAVRLTRPGTPLARDFALRAGRDAARVGVEHLGTTLRATAPGAPASLRSALTFAAHGLPSGAQTSDPTLDGVAVAAPPTGTIDIARLSPELQRLAGRTRLLSSSPPGFTTSTPAGPIGLPVPQARDVSGLARTLLANLDPVRAIRASVVNRIPALGPLVPVGSLPTVVPIGPVFSDALSPDLIALGGEWLIPGVATLKRNRVRLVEVNAAFVASFLVGANHELARELLWRDYPVDVRATFFHRFWQYLDSERADTGDIATTWQRARGLADNLAPAAQELTAVVVRGDLVRRYPTAHWFLQQAVQGADGHEPVEGTIVEVSFLATLDAQTTVFGFDLSPSVVRGDGGGDGYFIGVEEQPAGPRFGLDTAKPRDYTDTPKTWDKLSWGHLVASEEELNVLTHVTTSGVRVAGLEREGATWGANSAHQARATWQRPFRMLIHAERLI
jgi:hypothetical protein